MADRDIEHSLPAGDPGDDTFRRYRYQATYGAILCVHLLAKESFTELYCEHYEDILIKKSNGKYLGVQVKTQQPGRDLWKSTDTAMRDVVKRFIALENEFGDLFERYIIATNHQFYLAENGNSLQFLSERAKLLTHDGSEAVDGRLGKYLRGMSKRAECAQATVCSVLSKLHLDHGLPKLAAIDHGLRETISHVCPRFRLGTVVDLEEAAQALAQMTYQASSLPERPALSVYLSLADDPPDAEVKERIAKKRITREAVQQALDQVLTTPTVVASAPIPPGAIPKDLSLVDRKLAAGGLSATTVCSAADWRASAEYLERQWAAKYGERRGLEMYHHVATIVQTECATAYEVSTNPKKRFGPAMLVALRKGLDLRQKDSNTQLYESQDEHLLGHAMIRTGQCKVWWSEPFDVAGETS